MENKFLKGLKRGWENPTEHTEMTEANNKSKAEARDEIWLRQDDQQGQARNIKKAGKVIGGSVNKAPFHIMGNECQNSDKGNILRRKRHVSQKCYAKPVETDIRVLHL